MPKRVNLTDTEGQGQKYALFKDMGELNAGDRRAVRGAAPYKLTEVDGSNALVYPGDHEDLMRNALLVRVITEWNLDYPIPAHDPTVLDKLDLGTIDRLYDACAPYMAYFNENVVNPLEVGSDPTADSAS